MSIVEYAKRELAMIEHDEDGMQDMMDNNIIEILERFEEQGHSGFSAGYLIACLERLLRFLPLTPLTGEEDEWNEIGEGKYQNKRCRVVKPTTDRYNAGVQGCMVEEIVCLKITFKKIIKTTFEK